MREFMRSKPRNHHAIFNLISLRLFFFYFLFKKRISRKTLKSMLNAISPVERVRMSWCECLCTEFTTNKEQKKNNNKKIRHKMHIIYFPTKLNGRPEKSKAEKKKNNEQRNQRSTCLCVSMCKTSYLPNQFVFFTLYSSSPGISNP